MAEQVMTASDFEAARVQAQSLAQFIARLAAAETVLNSAIEAASTLEQYEHRLEGLLRGCEAAERRVQLLQQEESQLEQHIAEERDQRRQAWMAELQAEQARKELAWQATQQDAEKSLQGLEAAIEQAKGTLATLTTQRQDLQVQITKLQGRLTAIGKAVTAALPEESPV